MTRIKLRNLMRTVAVASAVLLATGAGSAFAQIDTDGYNDTTGPNSINENIYDIDDTLEIDVVNSSDIDEVLDIDVTTGDNDITGNSIVDGVESGDIEGEIVFETLMNTSGDLDLGIEGLDVDADFVNDTTGPFSENINSLDLDRTVDVDITNSADVDHVVDADFNTGDNDISNNTIVGDFEGGDIDFDMEVVTETNTNAPGIDLGALTNSSVSGDFVNDTTGPNSVNTNTVDVDSTVDLDVTNVVDVIHSFDIDGNTGGNTVDGNTEVGDVSSGDVNFSVRSTTVAN